MSRKTIIASFLTLALCIASAGTAAGANIDSSLITWDAAPGYHLTLTVSGGGQSQTLQFKDGESPSLSLTDEAGKLLADGSYTWQLTAAPALGKDERAILSEAREAGVALSAKSGARGYTESGYFAVSGGSFVTPSFEDVDAQKDQVYLDDLIVEGSACIGIDCANGENFSFDTLRLKENNLRIKFEDTSASANFPGNDWNLVANDSDNGGANRFSIEDVDGGKVPFTVEAGAPNHSLYVDDAGNIGVNTATPVVEFHITDGDSPTLRLEQDGSSGFQSQTWDIAGNEANFFVRDVNNGSKLPFKIKPNAPTDSLFVAANGDIGIGTASPSAALHVKRTGSDDELLMHLESTTATRADVKLTNSTDTWTISNPSNNVFSIDLDSSGLGTLFRIQPDGDVLVQGNLQVCLSGTGGGAACSTSNFPDYVFEEDYPLMPLDELKSFLAREKHLPKVPSIAEVAENGINMTQLQLSMLEKVEELTLYTLQQHQTIGELKAELEALKASMTE